MSRTRNQSKQEEWSDPESNPPPPRRRARAEEEDEGSSSITSVEDDDQEWSTKVDGRPIEQSWVGAGIKRGEGAKRGRATSRGRGQGRASRVSSIKLEDASPDQKLNRRSRPRSQAADDSIVSDRPEEDDSHGTSAASLNKVPPGRNEVEGGRKGNVQDEAGEESEHDIEPTARRSGRIRRSPQKYVPDEDRKVIPSSKALASVKLKKARSRRRSPSESPDPITEYEDDNADLISGLSSPGPVHEHEDDQEQRAGSDQGQGVDHIPSEVPRVAHHGVPPKGVLKRPHGGISTGPNKKKAVVIDESRNQVKTIRSIKLITSSSSTSSSERHPPPRRPRGPHKYARRLRKAINEPIPVIPPRKKEGLQAQKGTPKNTKSTRRMNSSQFEVSSDSSEDPLLLRQSQKVEKEHKAADRMSLLALAASLSRGEDDPTTLSTSSTGNSGLCGLHNAPHIQQVPPTASTLSSLSTTQPLLTPRPILPNLIPVRLQPPPTFDDDRVPLSMSKPNHPNEIEQENIWNAFVEASMERWDEVNRPRLNQVEVFRLASIPNSIEIGTRRTAHIEEIPEQQESKMDASVTPSSEPVADLPTRLPPFSQITTRDEIERPGLDFEKSCQRLASLQLTQRPPKIRLPIPGLSINGKRLPKF